MKQLEEKEKKLYDQQTIELTKYRGILEYDFLQKKNKNQFNMATQNLEKNFQTIHNEDSLKKQKLEEEKARIEMINKRGMKQEFKWQSKINFK